MKNLIIFGVSITKGYCKNKLFLLKFPKWYSSDFIVVFSIISTFFRALTGLTPCNTGKILIRDFENSEPNAAKMVKEGDIGFVDQKYTLFRHKTVHQALKFSLRKTTLSDTEKESKKVDLFVVHVSHE